MRSVLMFECVKSANFSFINRHKHYLTGRVLDFGCGYQPHKHLCTGEYVGYDPGYADYDTGDKDKRVHITDWSGHFDTVLMSQVLQTLDNPIETISRFDTDRILATMVTTWREYEPCDKYRYTFSGIENLMNRCGYALLVHEPIHPFEYNGIVMNFGHGVVYEKR